MSNHTLLEFNHDYVPAQEDRKSYADQLCLYMSSGDKRFLPDGVSFLKMFHHSDPFPFIQKEKLEQVLLDHWPQLICDHANKRDTVVCGCSKVNLGLHKNVGLAMKSWIKHLIEEVEKLKWK